MKAGYKQTEVGVIPDDWQVQTLGDCLLAKPEYGINAPAVPYSDALPTYIRITDITDDGRFSPEKITSVKTTDVEKYRLNIGDLVFARTGASTGKTYLYNSKDGELIFAGFLIRVKVNPNKLNPFYLANYTQTKAYWNWVRVMSQRSGQPGVNGEEYSRLQIPLPPLPEQQAIATALSDVDALIATLDAVIAKKRKIKDCVTNELLKGKSRLAGFSAEWSTRNLGELADIQRGASPRPIDSPLWYDVASKVGWIRISDVTNSGGRFLTKTHDYLSDQGIAHSRYLPSDSLIMSICATVGMPVITQMDACIHDGFVGFTRLRNIDQTFLYYKLKELEPSFKVMGQTGSQNNLNTDLVKNCPVALPSIEEQQAIVQILSDMDAEIEGLERKRAKYHAVKQGMMQELLTGKTRLV